MKVLSTEGLTKLIQLIKSSFISVNDVEQTSEVTTETTSEITLATVATSGSYNDLNNKPDLSVYALNSDIDTLLATLYPVGSIYIGTQSTCPLASIISGSTWTLVAQDKALWTSDGTNANTTIAAGLPNITGDTDLGSITGVSYATTISQVSGAFGRQSTGRVANVGSNYVEDKARQLYFDASRSNSIYGNSTTVQPPAYVVNVWRRTA